MAEAIMSCCNRSEFFFRGEEALLYNIIEDPALILSMTKDDFLLSERRRTEEKDRKPSQSHRGQSFLGRVANLADAAYAGE